MKIISMIATVLISINAMADLADNTPVEKEYIDVTIKKVVSVTSNITYAPKSPTSMAYYEGQVYVTAVVEGNICDADPRTLGLASQYKGDKKYLKLVVARQLTAEDVGCTMHSSSATVTFPISVRTYELSTSGVQETLANISYAGDFPNLQPGTSEIILKAKGSKVEVLNKITSN